MPSAQRPRNVIRSIFILATALLLAGCATSTIETRKRARAATYTALPPDVKSLVDNGQIKAGMSEDAVYIAWGPPAEILHNESANAAESTWLYYGGWMQETRYWSHRHLDRDYLPRTYVSAEIVFVNGQVVRWRTLPRPPY
jgi:hypothetical protein